MKRFRVFCTHGIDAEMHGKPEFQRFFCNHYYIYKGGDFNAEGKVIRSYLRCKKCGKVKKINGPFKEGVL